MPPGAGAFLVVDMTASFYLKGWPMLTSRTALTGLASAALSLTLLVAPAHAQDRGPGGPGGQGGGRWGQMSDQDRQQMREQMRQRMEERQQEMAERLREQLGMSAEEFGVIQPRIEAVEDLQREREMATRMGGRGGWGRGGDDNADRPGRGGGGGNNADRPGRGGGDNAGGQRRGGFGFGGGMEFSAEGQQLQQSSRQLQQVVRDDNATSEQVQQALQAFRSARDTMDGKIDKAQEDLRQLLTAKQEATLVANGTLD